MSEKCSNIDWNEALRDIFNNQTACKEFLDEVYVASSGIRVIDPTDKESDHDLIEAAKQFLKDARCVYILGYGFDENNNKRLGLSALHRGSNKCVLFTNYNNSNRINKSASRMLIGDPYQFLTASSHGDQRTGFYFERSTRDTYEALELDFDALEEQLLSSTHD
jgi:hypothetical protein